ncbi:MAG: TIM barrel protein, partial [Planctomycetota bacterium]
VRGLVAGANHGSYTSLMMRQCLTCLSNHHSAPHAKWIGYLFTGTKHFKKELGRVYDHPRTGILVDVGHMHMRMTQSDYFSGMTVADYLDRLPLPLVELHLHDNHGDKDEHGHFGLGTVPFADIAAWVKAHTYDGECTIEIAPTFHGSTPELSRPKAVESLRRWKELLGWKV